MRADGHFGQLFRLFVQLLFGVVVDGQLIDAVHIFFRFFQRAVAFTQLVGDHAQLFAQIIVALVLVHGLLHALLDRVFQPQDIGLFTQHAQQILRAALHGGRFQNKLLVFHGKIQVRGQIIAQPADVLRAGHPHRQIGRDVLRQLRILAESGLAFAQQRFLLNGIRHAALQTPAHRALHVRFRLYNGQQPGAIQALRQYAEGVVLDFDDLLDFGDRPDGAKIFRLRFVDRHILLRYQKNLLLGRNGGFQRGQRTGAADVEMQLHMRKDH